MCSSCGAGGGVGRSSFETQMQCTRFAKCGDTGFRQFDNCPGVPCCRPSFQPPYCSEKPPSYGPIVIPLTYPCPCSSNNNNSRPLCGQPTWPPPSSGSGQTIHLVLGDKSTRAGCGFNGPQVNCPPRCGPCGRIGHSQWQNNGCNRPSANDLNCNVRSPCPRPQVPYSDGCAPPPCKPCCTPPCCNPLPPCCVRVRPCEPKCCPSKSCKPPPLCCPNPCCPQPDPRCCPKPQILAFMCPQNPVPCCTKKPCQCGE